MDRFGLSEEFKDNLRLQVEIANLKARLVITGQRHLRTQIKIKEEEFLANSPSDKPPVELETLLAKMSKYYGFKLESKELTVTQYYSYLNEVNNG